MSKRLSDRERLLRSISEAAWQRTVIECAQAHGWKVNATRQSGKTLENGKRVTIIEADGKGYSDLTCVHPVWHRLVWIENKTQVGRVTPEQHAWLDWLTGVPGVEGYVLRPGNADALLTIFGPRTPVERDRSR